MATDKKAGYLQMLEEAKDRLFPTASGKSTALPTLKFYLVEADVRLLHSRTVRVNFYCFKLPHLSKSVARLTEN